MGLFGPSQYEIQKAIENAISPKTHYNTRYCLRAFVSAYDDKGKRTLYQKDFPMSDIAFQKAYYRKIAYSAIVDWFNKEFAPKATQVNENTIFINSKPASLDRILAASKTTSITEYPLTYKSETFEGGFETVCVINPVSFKEEWTGFKPSNIEEL